MLFLIAVMVTALKLLLIPSYRSTDFEVHRNWLAITHNLPLNQWYFESTSEWTLDYPPLFAWFEYLLSHIAVVFDQEMLKLDNLYYASDKTILFQRLSVICTDFVYIYGVKECTAVLANAHKKVILSILLIANTGLLMVDHIHFQYNGFIYGVLLISIAQILQGKYIQGAFWFTVLLNLKHLFLYLAPAYFIFLLRNYCFSENPSLKKLFQQFSINRTAKLGATVLGVFFVTYLPFYDHLGQVIARLFPFKRGLCHAYWAPNIWAVYNVVDKLLLFAAKNVGVNVTSRTASMTGGLVQEFSHAVLPDIKPLTTLCLTALMLLPAMYKLWKSGANTMQFIRCIVICGLTSFLFGWHVHEKAILMTIIPLSLLSISSPQDAKIFLILSTVGHYSLFPLLFPSSLTLVKCLLLITYAGIAFYSLFRVFPYYIQKQSLPLLNSLESIYLLGLIAVFAYTDIIHNFVVVSNKYEFVPLLLTSVYCSLGVIYCWIQYYIFFITISTDRKRKNQSNKKKR